MTITASLHHPASGLSLIAPVSKQLAVQGEYVHLEDFLVTNPWPVTDEDLSKIYMNSRGEFTNRPLNYLCITQLEKWLEAWNMYERVLMCHDDTLYHGLATYRDFILQCNKKFHWSAVYAYDRRYRAQLAAHKSLEYGNIDNDLHNEVFDSASVRRDLQRCYRCQSIQHPVKLCPFPRNSPRRRRSKRYQTPPHSLSQGCTKVTTDIVQVPNLHENCTVQQPAVIQVPAFSDVSFEITSDSSAEVPHIQTSSPSTSSLRDCTQITSSFLTVPSGYTTISAANFNMFYPP